MIWYYLNEVFRKDKYIEIEHFSCCLGLGVETVNWQVGERVMEVF
jgi:hypothetical protein